MEAQNRAILLNKEMNGFYHFSSSFSYSSLAHTNKLFAYS